MNNTNHASRQNRALVITLAVILAFAAVLICLTLMQDRRQKPVPLAPQDSSATPDTTTPNTTAQPESTETTPAVTEEAVQQESDTAAAAEPDVEAEPVNAEEKLPDFISPIAGMISKTHALDVPVYSLTMNDYRTHSGVDIVSTAGAAVCAAADGVIGEIWEDPMMGTCLSIDHTGGARSIYKNLSPQLPEGVVVGAAVKVGDKIASIGESALAEVAESPHLHYELEVDGVCVNPADYMLIGSEDTGYEG